MINEFEEYLKGAKDLRGLCNKLSRVVDGTLNLSLQGGSPLVLLVRGKFNTIDWGCGILDFSKVPHISTDSYLWSANINTLSIYLNEVIDNKQLLSYLSEYNNRSELISISEVDMFQSCVTFIKQNPSVINLLQLSTDLSRERDEEIKKVTEKYNNMMSEASSKVDELVESHRNTTKAILGHDKLVEDEKDIKELLTDNYNFEILSGGAIKFKD